MNAINDNNDPFEDIFRNRFTDFESEPDTQLWQKIEPKLPVDSIRKFPYWQISAVAILLLLAGLWTYFNKYSDNVVTKLANRQTESVVINSSSLVSTQSIKPNKPLIVNDLLENPTNGTTVKSERKIIIEKILLHESSVGMTKTNRQSTAGEIVVKQDNKTKNFPLFSKRNTTIESPNASLEKEKVLGAETRNNFSENNKTQLNLFADNNSNEKQQINIENSSNNSSVSSVFSDKKKRFCFE